MAPEQNRAHHASIIHGFLNRQFRGVPQNSQSSRILSLFNEVKIQARDDGLMYATNTSGSWVTETVDTYGTRSSIASDSMDNVHVTYALGGLRYATNATGAWVVETVIEAEYGWPHWGVGGSPSIAVDGSDNVHISSICGDGYINRLQYSSNATGTWVTGDMGMGCLGLPLYSTASIAVDSTGTVHIGFSTFDLEDMNLKVMVGSNRCVREVCDNCFDDDCDGLYGYLDEDPDCLFSCAAAADASASGATHVHGPSDLGKHLVYLLLPVGVVVAFRISRSKK